MHTITTMRVVWIGFLLIGIVSSLGVVGIYTDANQDRQKNIGLMYSHLDTDKPTKYDSDQPIWRIKYAIKHNELTGSEQIIEQATQAWVDLNPRIYFIKVGIDDPDAELLISFRDMKFTDDVVSLYCDVACEHFEFAGRIMTDEVIYFGDNEIPEILLDIMTHTCDYQLVEYSSNTLVDSLTHEIGHYLGLEHTDDGDHLMFAADSIASPYDDLGYAVPSPLEPYVLVVGQTEISQELDALDQKLTRFDARFEDPDISEADYNRVVISYNQLLEKYNSYVDQYNCLGDLTDKDPGHR